MISSFPTFYSFVLFPFFQVDQDRLPASLPIGITAVELDHLRAHTHGVTYLPGAVTAPSPCEQALYLLKTHQGDEAMLQSLIDQ